MKTYFNGHGVNPSFRWHEVQYFDGRRVREISILTCDYIIRWIDNPVPGVIENNMDYKTAKRRVASYEKQAARRY